MRVRTTVVAAGALVLCLAAGCGPDGDGGQGTGGDKGPGGKATASASPTTGATPEADPAPVPTSDGRTLTEAGLAKAALATGDLPGWAFAPLPGTDERGTEEPDDRACAPITAIINGSPDPAPAATVFRTATATTTAETGAGGDGTVVTVILTSHRAGGAEELMRSVRDAVRACADGFRTTSEDGPSTYTGVRALPAPKAGQESFAYQVTGSLEGVRIPLVFHLVRTGSTVATFYAAAFSADSAPEVPAALVTAQAARLP
ncbi:hypothetical protein ACFYY2_07250 [Streptomyces sp. NPDC001822]|uniref:hypothetical protein n=1 Tax=Streptomyces sp. NPDC001822 TaxID=3364614 RepID=UPI0036BC2560